MVAIFEDDKLYIECMSILEKVAEKRGMILTESVEEEDLSNLYKNFKHEL